MRSIEDQFTKNRIFAAMTAGAVRSFADGTRFWLSSAVEILQVILVTATLSTDAVDRILRQLEAGIPESALPLLALPVQLERGEYLGLVQAGFGTPDLVWQAGKERLQGVLSRRRVKELLAHSRLPTPANAVPETK
jgi:hypothetical protein